MAHEYPEFRLRLPNGDGVERARGVLLDETGTNGSRKFLVRAGSPARDHVMPSLGKHFKSPSKRREELKAQGVRPRVWFGERFITSVFDHFEENVTYFPALLPVCDDEDPVEVLARGDTPRLSELRNRRAVANRYSSILVSGLKASNGFWKTG